MPPGGGAGYLKAVWPGFFGCVFQVSPAPGAREGLQNCGVRSPPYFARLSRAPGAGQTSKSHPTNPARLPSGTQAVCVASQRDPGVVCWPSCFGGLGYQGQDTTHVEETNGFWPCRRRRQGQQTTIFLKVCDCLSFVPQASNKNPWPKKHYGIFLNGESCTCA
jgi:hypothetical protein